LARENFLTYSFHIKRIYATLDAVLGALYNGSMKIIAPVVGKTEREIFEAAISLNKNDRADLIEWRADYYGGEPLEVLTRLKKISRKPLIFTYRSKNEGGFGAPQSRDMLWKAALIADYTDFEFYASEFGPSLDFTNGNGVIVSRHDFSGTPPKEELIKLGKDMIKSGAKIIKIAVAPNCDGDVLEFLNAANYIKTLTRAGQETIFISMGRLGVPCRIFPELFASDYTFASSGQSSAPGQISLEKLVFIRDSL
jgi:3-dehydroquinate dehydratase-1